MKTLKSLKIITIVIYLMLIFLFIFMCFKNNKVEKFYIHPNNENHHTGPDYGDYPVL